MSSVSTKEPSDNSVEIPVDSSQEKVDSIESKKSSKKVEDLEVKDAQLIFQTVWHELEQEMGVENLKFPAEIFWLNGAPGAGKGTQAKIISKFLNISHLSTGDILRKKLLDNDDLAKKLQSIMSSGNLVSDDILNSIVSSRLKNETENGFILDGYPRTLPQSEFLNNFFLETSASLDYIFDIQINFEILKNRIIKRSSEEGREDDNINVIETRYNEYLNSTQKVSNIYKDKYPSIFYQIDGSQQIQEITKKIIDILKKS